MGKILCHLSAHLRGGLRAEVAEVQLLGCLEKVGDAVHSGGCGTEAQHETRVKAGGFNKSAWHPTLDACEEQPSAGRAFRMLHGPDCELQDLLPVFTRVVDVAGLEHHVQQRVGAAILRLLHKLHRQRALGLAVLIATLQLLCRNRKDPFVPTAHSAVQ
jgi:hypothetical protein